MIRGQERDPYKDPSTVSYAEMRDRYIILGRVRRPASTWPTYRAARARRIGSLPGCSSRPWMRSRWPPGRTGLSSWLQTTSTSRALGPAPGVRVSLYDEGYKGKEPLDDNYGTDDYLTNRQLLRMRAPLRRRGHHDGPLAREVHRAGARARGNGEDPVRGRLRPWPPPGEHGYTGKLAYALYPELTDIVLMVRHPQGERGWQEQRLLLPPTTSPQRSLASRGGAGRTHGRSGSEAHPGG